MRLSHATARTRASFDDPHLVSHAGLVPVMALAADRTALPGRNPGKLPHRARDLAGRATLKWPRLLL